VAGPSFKQRTVMVVESSTQLQDKFRDLFKTNGFRVLVTSNPLRPGYSFNDGERGADCVVFSTTELGEEALDSFNGFGQDPLTREVPAILLLGPKHGAWSERASIADHRVILTTPIKVRELRETLDRLMPLEQSPARRA
jgi:serine/threonine-protein kinase